MVNSKSQQSRREMQAAQTRADIIQAARRHFAASGYVATSLRTIAHDVGVSVQTIYDSVGSKADLVRSLNDLIDEEAQVGEIAREIGIENDPKRLATIPARITVRIVERCGDILRACIEAERTDPGLADVLEEGMRRHRVGTSSLANRLANLGALREGFDAERAATSLAAIADPRIALVLYDDYAMPPDEIELWIIDLIERVVLAH